MSFVKSIFLLPVVSFVGAFVVLFGFLSYLAVIFTRIPFMWGCLMYSPLFVTDMIFSELRLNMLACLQLFL